MIFANFVAYVVFSTVLVKLKVGVPVSEPAVARETTASAVEDTIVQYEELVPEISNLPVPSTRNKEVTAVVVLSSSSPSLLVLVK